MKVVLPALAVLVPLLSSAATPQTAQTELISLSDWVDLPKEERELSYLYVRCAALYEGVYSYVGVEKLGQETAKDYESFVLLNSMKALMLRQEKRPLSSSNELVEEVSRDRKALSKIYNERMHKNYLRVGQAFLTDELMRGDFEICRLATRRLVQ